MPTTESWYLLESGPGAAPDNMAWDEALLRSVARWGRPVLRFYAWQTPAATFGYFQKYAEVSQWTCLRPLIRRPTGGGLVLHEADWTYSLAFPPVHPWYSKRAVASYQDVHEWIQAAFARLDTETVLAPARRLEFPGQCFVGAEQHDLLWQDRKIAGAAQHRIRGGLLIQGSVQSAAAGLDRARWEKALRDVASARLDVDWVRLVPDPELHELASNLTREKYDVDNYNRRR